MRNSRWKVVVYLLNILLFVISIILLYMASNHVDPKSFLEARLAVLHRMNEKVEGVKGVAKAITKTEEGIAKSSELSLADVREIEEAMMVAMANWAIDQLVAEGKVPIIPAFGKQGAKSLLEIQQGVLQTEFVLLQDESVDIQQALQMHKDALAKLETDDLTLTEFMNCCIISTSTNLAIINKLKE